MLLILELLALQTPLQTHKPFGRCNSALNLSINELFLQERKKELVSIQGQLEARRAAFVEGEKQSRGREVELAGQLAVAQAQLCEVRAAAARTNEEQLQAVLAGSQAVSGFMVLSR